ncbi:hypothetical protein J7L36_00235 [bacterium]|nr:hypothetical protein [bacterium]
MKIEKKIKYLALILLLIYLVFPCSASADLAGILDTAEVALEGVEEISGPIAKQLLTILFGYVFGLIILYFSTFLLQYSMALTATTNALGDVYLSLTKNPMVLSGWNFVSGITNMFLILIFVVIALAMILRIETFQAKKALPRLLIVALLTNFSLVFIGMLVDIANIFYNTIFITSWNTPYTIVSALLMSGTSAFISLGTMLATWAASYMIPFVGSAAQYALVTMINIVSFPLISFMVFQVFCFFLISGIFLIYAFLFIARVFIIQLLAIISPLAFLCFILPQTQKYWNEWLKHLIEWTFLGIFLLFFLSLGLNIAALLIPSMTSYLTVSLNMMGAWWLTGSAWFLAYYLVIFIYLVIVAWLSKKTMPTMAETLISQAKALGGMVWQRGIKPFAGATGRQLIRTAAQQVKEKEAAEIEGRKLSRRERLAGILAQPTRWATRAAYGTTPEAMVAKDIEAKSKEFEERFGTDFASAASVFKGLTPENKTAMALYLARKGGGKALDRLSDKQLRQAVETTARYTPDKLKNIIAYKPELVDEREAAKIVEGANAAIRQREREGAPMSEIIPILRRKEEALKNYNMAKLIQKTLVSKGVQDKDVQALRRLKGITPKELEETPALVDELIREAAIKKAMDAIKVADVEKVSPKTFENEIAREMIVRFKSPDFIKKIGEELGQELIEKIRAKVEELGPEEIAKTNASLLRSAITNPGFKAVFPPIKGAETINKVEAASKLAKEPLLLLFYKKTQETEKLVKEFEEVKKTAPKDVVARVRKDLEKDKKDLEKVWEKIKSNKKLMEKWVEIQDLMKK